MRSWKGIYRKKKNSFSQRMDDIRTKTVAVIIHHDKRHWRLGQPAQSRVHNWIGSRQKPWIAGGWYLYDELNDERDERLSTVVLQWYPRKVGLFIPEHVLNSNLVYLCVIIQVRIDFFTRIRIDCWQDIKAPNKPGGRKFLQAMRKYFDIMFK